METETIAARLLRLRKAAGLTQAQLATQAGVSQGTIGNIESGVRGYGESIVDIATALGVSPDYLRMETDQWVPQSVSQRPSAEIDLNNNPDYPAIRYVSFKLSAGASGFGIDYVDERKRPLVFGREWYADHGYQPTKLFAIRVANGSMEPGLHHGDTVVVNTGDTNLKDGEVFAMNFEGELVVKRMVRDGGQWWLTSDNPDQRRYPRKICDEHVFCLGRVVHKQSERI